MNSDPLGQHIPDVVRMTADAMVWLAEFMAQAIRWMAKVVRRVLKALDPKWQRRWRRALARSRRNNLYLKSIGACR
ncbi:hypothetical protein [Collinsella sp. AF31-11]|uniref:hypothetical protein n=1 Tax=Collinsella sp. AF31-11 TaxID=2292011 RepID=UPI000E4D7F01|nr:hypothetical protein [Collinsella sp. AF31-11]RHN22662.1 hypothetical protein DWZ22_03125 [Collinsella sp. AF31-11]